MELEPWDAGMEASYISGVQTLRSILQTPDYVVQADNPPTHSERQLMADTLPGSPANVSTPSFSPIASVSGTFGGVYICAYMSLFLYGLFVHQAFKYLRFYSADATWLKTLVVVALVLETAVSALHIHLTYFYFVENYGNPLAFLEDVCCLSIYSLLFLFYAVRILLVGPTRYKYLPVVASALLMAGAMGVSIGITVVGFSGLRRTDSMINRLIMYAVSTGLLPTIFNVLSAVLTHTLGINNWAWLGTMMIAERRELSTLGPVPAISYEPSAGSDCILPVYSNSLMAALNSRRFTAENAREHSQHREDRRHGRADPFGTAIRLSTVRFDHGDGSYVNYGDGEGRGDLTGSRESQTRTAKRSSEDAGGHELGAENSSLKEARAIV